MTYVLDESSFRVDKTVFSTAQEAEQYAAESSRALGRPIAVYELADQQLGFAFRVMPNGTRDETQPTVEVPPGHVEPPQAPAVLGNRLAHYDATAEALERRGHLRLAAEVDGLTVGRPSRHRIDDVMRRARHCVEAATPDWPGADVVYSRMYRLLEQMGKDNWETAVRQARKKRRKVRPPTPTGDMQDIIEALDEGDEERLKGLMHRYQAYRV